MMKKSLNPLDVGMLLFQRLHSRPILIIEREWKVDHKVADTEALKVTYTFKERIIIIFHYLVNK